ncbi:MAG TPA: hypothetical protein VMU54_11135 [Planctomycetota bacterium]|nr:hypothetical protein [Planctomycetota bacterium]
MSEAVAAPDPWIVGRRYDLLWFFGGAAASLGVLALHFVARVPIVILYWTWLLGFDGPHIAAAFTRTYADRDEWRIRRRILVRSLLLFATGPGALLLNLATGSPEPFQLFLGIATFYGYYHVVRQHYGFLALYKARSRDTDPVDFQVDRAFLYVTCWAPYVYFLFTHPRARALLRLPPGGPAALWEKAAVLLILVVWGAAVAAFLLRLAARFPERIRRPHVPYLLILASLYGVAYVVVARFEPVYAQSRGPDQDFLLLSIIVTIFHNVQYLGLVWFHNRNRYGHAGGDPGPARAINRSPARFLLACLSFSVVVYSLSAAATGVFPGFQLLLETRIGPFTANQIGLCLWWGIGLNHYYLDQKIWRIKGDAELKRNLGFI